MINRLHKQNLKSVLTYNVDPVHVQDGLSVTPAQMHEMTQHGIPISSQMSDSMFYDGDSKPLTDIDPLMRRGVDAVDAWNLQKQSRKNLKNANSVDIQNYGN